MVSMTSEVEIVEQNQAIYNIFSPDARVEGREMNDLQEKEHSIGLTFFG